MRTQNLLQERRTTFYSSKCYMITELLFHLKQTKTMQVNNFISSTVSFKFPCFQKAKLF